MDKNEIIIYKDNNDNIECKVSFSNDTLWLSLDQISKVFKKDKSTISRHIRNIFESEELDKNSVVANFATTANDGKTYNVDYYNLDMIAMNKYINGLITNAEVIEELLKIAKQIKEGSQPIGDLNDEEIAFYDALTKSQAVKDFYKNEELINMTRELTDSLRRNKTIDWQKKESARANMRRIIKRLLKKYNYPPEEAQDALQTVMTQCELWTDNLMIV